MTPYYPPDQSAEAAYGQDTARIVRLLGERFMAENPPAPFVWRTFCTDGVFSDRRGCYHMDFSRLFPDARVGQIAFAAADLYCPRSKSSGFFVTCLGPVQVWLNGQRVFVSNGDHERSHDRCRIQVDLQEGRNRFVFRCECTLIGFGCGFANAMPQWEPCNYIVPYAEYAGEAGFACTAPVDEADEPDTAVFFSDAAPASLRYPGPLTPLADAQGRYAMWCRVQEGRCAAPLPCPAAVDGLAVQSIPAHACVLHAIGTLDELARLRCMIGEERIALPMSSFGRCTPWLIAGPLADVTLEQVTACGPGQLLDGLNGPVTWQPAFAGMALRPYVETNLFGRWTYPLGVTLYGMWQAGHALELPQLNDYVLAHLRQVTGIHDYACFDQARFGFPGVNQQLCWLDALDDCGSFGSMMLECAPEDAASVKLAHRIGQYMLREQPRTEDGAFCRRDATIWADDMYMSGPFLCRYSALTGDPAGIDECAEQLLKYKALLFIPDKQVMSHMRCLRNGRANGIPWSRGNGWVLFTLSELLSRLPQEHPRRDALLTFFRELTSGYLRLQDEDGMWHQLLDGPETYQEASATAMFICAFARGLRGGWYPGQQRGAIREALAHAWQGLCRVAIDRDGNLYGVCRGSGFSFSRAYYRRLMWNFNDTHGIGIVMLAGVEYLRTCGS